MWNREWAEEGGHAEPGVLMPPDAGPEQSHFPIIFKSCNV